MCIRDSINSGGANRKTDIMCQFQNIRFSGNTGNYGWAITTPSQNLVDMFEVKGLNDDNYYPYNDPRANFSWDAPYDNRDPRFYNNILYPGASYGVDKTGAKLYLEPWEGGQDYNKDNNYERMVCSGYMCIKFWWPTALSLIHISTQICPLESSFIDIIPKLAYESKFLSDIFFIS